jgi:hypothetical protein
VLRGHLLIYIELPTNQIRKRLSRIKKQSRYNRVIEDEYNKTIRLLGLLRKNKITKKDRVIRDYKSLISPLPVVSNPDLQ